MIIVAVKIRKDEYENNKNIHLLRT